MPALSIPLVNTVHLGSKPFPLSPEDNTHLSNVGNKNVLEIDLGSGKYWSLYGLNVSNTGSQQSIINLNATTSLTQIERSALCEVVGNGNWQCVAPRSHELEIDLSAGQTRQVLVFVHTQTPIADDLSYNRIYIEAKDSFGELVAKNGISVKTVN